MDAIPEELSICAAANFVRCAGKAWKVGMVNGCFDILHSGHVDLLRRARGMCDALVVGVNSDRSIRTIKGPSRPIVLLNDRVAVLRELRHVDVVFAFDEPNCAEAIRAIKPWCWFKGPDYSMETLNKDEVAAAREVGVSIRFLDRYSTSSTTGIISDWRNRMNAAVDLASGPNG